MRSLTCGGGGGGSEFTETKDRLVDGEARVGDRVKRIKGIKRYKLPVIK